MNDPEVRLFVDKCLASVSERSSARELLDDPFLRVDVIGKEMRMTNHEDYFDKVDRVLQLPDPNDSHLMSTASWDYTDNEPDHEFEYQELAENEMDLFTSLEDDNLVNADITINGKRKEDGDIFLRLRIKDKEGRIRNIYFPFDTEIDTALSVAAEMVAELDIDDQDVTKIADMIDGVIASLVPDWETGIGISVGEESEPSSQNPKPTETDTLESCLGQGVGDWDENSEPTQTKILESSLGHRACESDENSKPAKTSTIESCLRQGVCESDTNSEPAQPNTLASSLGQNPGGLGENSKPSQTKTLESCLGHGVGESDNHSKPTKTKTLESYLELDVSESNVGNLTPRRGHVRKASLADFLLLDNRGSNSSRMLRCSSHGSSSMRGRFEEITIEPEATEDNFGTDYRDKWPHHRRRPSLRFHGLTEINFDESSDKDERIINIDDRKHKGLGVDPRTPYNSPASSVVDEIEYDNAILKEQIWLKAKHQMQLRELTDQNPSAKLKPPILPTKNHNSEAKRDNKKTSLLSRERGLDVNELKRALRKHFPSNFPSNFGNRTYGDPKPQKHRSETCSPEHMVGSNSFYSATLLPHSLQRTTSLPVDAVDC